MAGSLFGICLESSLSDKDARPVAVGRQIRIHWRKVIFMIKEAWENLSHPARRRATDDQLNLLFYVDFKA